MSVRRKLIVDTLLYGAGDVLTKAIAFVLIPLYTNALIPAEYGVYQLLVLFVTVTMVFAMSGMNVALFKHFVVAREEKQRRDLFTSTLIWVVVGSLIIIALAYIFSGPLAELLTGSENRGKLVGLAAVNAGLETVILVSLLIFRMEKKPVGYVSYNLVKVILILGGNFLLVWKLDMGVEGIILAGIIADLVILAPILLRVGRYLSFPLRPRLIYSMLLWGIPFIPASIATVVLTLSDRLLLRFMSGFEAAGIYSVGYKIAGAIFLLYTAFRFAWGPYMFELARSNESANESYPRVLLPVISALGFAAVGLVALSPEIFKFFVGDSYHAARAVLIPVSMAPVFEAMSLFFGAGLQTRDRTIYAPAVTGLAAIVNILLNVLLIPRFGFMGAAWATLISYGVMAYISHSMGNRFMPVSYPWGIISAIVITASAGIAGAWFLEPLTARIGVILASGALLGIFGFRRGMPGNENLR